jgi:hypothetical protein
LEGNLLGVGAARNVAGCGLEPIFFAGEKCCWRVENAGLRTDVSAYRDCGRVLTGASCSCALCDD